MCRIMHVIAYNKSSVTFYMQKHINDKIIKIIELINMRHKNMWDDNCFINVFFYDICRE